jgi:hypothetical protein
MPLKNLIAALTLAASVTLQSHSVAADAEALANAKARVDAAKTAYDDLWKLAKMDPARHPLDFDKLCTWSTRWMDAQRDAAGDADARAKAVEDHLARVKEVGKMAKDMAKNGITARYDIAVTDYHRLEAERLAAGEKKK